VQEIIPYKKSGKENVVIMGKNKRQVLKKACFLRSMWYNETYLLIGEFLNETEVKAKV